MNTRNQNDDNWYLNTTTNAVKFFVVLVVIGLAIMALYFKQCSNPQPNLRVPYNPTYTKPDTICKDWVKDESVCIERRIVYDQMLNEKLAR